VDGSRQETRTPDAHANEANARRRATVALTGGQEPPTWMFCTLCSPSPIETTIVAGTSR
jgi:hypothetical protein